jgi:hypothetical protein
MRFLQFVLPNVAAEGVGHRLVQRASEFLVRIAAVIDRRADIAEISTSTLPT